MWQKVSEKMPEMGVEVIGYNQDWVDEDFNPNGTRVCFYDDTGWYSAKWNNDQDSYSTVGCARCECSEDNCEFSSSCKLKADPTHWIPMPKWKRLKLSNLEEKPTSSPKWQKRSTKLLTITA